MAEAPLARPDSAAEVRRNHGDTGAGTEIGRICLPEARRAVPGKSRKAGAEPGDRTAGAPPHATKIRRLGMSAGGGRLTVEGGSAEADA